MRRFFIDKSRADLAEKDGTAEISGGDYNHIVNVLRMRTGGKLILSASDGREFQTVITGIEKGRVTVSVVSVSANSTEPDVPVILIQGVPKGDKTELIIQKCVELGVCGIIPVITEHTVVRLSEADAEKKRARWQKIAEEAAKQCGRGTVPEIGKVTGLSAAVSSRPSDELKLFAYENEDQTTLRKVLEEAGPGFRGGISLVIGPEGGFSAQEADTITAAGFTAVSLGKRILRTETAGMAALAGIRMYFED